MYLVIVNTHRKGRPEVIPIKSTTSFETMEVLKSLFPSFWLSEQLVSDNGSQFTLKEFQAFVKPDQHVTYAPYHQATNAFAERSLPKFKQALHSIEKF